MSSCFYIIIVIAMISSCSYIAGVPVIRVLTEPEDTCRYVLFIWYRRNAIMSWGQVNKKRMWCRAWVHSHKYLGHRNTHTAWHCCYSLFAWLVVLFVCLLGWFFGGLFCLFGWLVDFWMVVCLIVGILLFLFTFGCCCCFVYCCGVFVVSCVVLCFGRVVFCCWDFFF